MYVGTYIHMHLCLNEDWFSNLSSGPTPNSISDFWQMIWDHRPPVLVMLTQPEEKGRVSSC